MKQKAQPNQKRTTRDLTTDHRGDDHPFSPVNKQEPGTLPLGPISLKQLASPGPSASQTSQPLTHKQEPTPASPTAASLYPKCPFRREIHQNWGAAVETCLDPKLVPRTPVYGGHGVHKKATINKPDAPLLPPSHWTKSLLQPLRELSRLTRDDLPRAQRLMRMEVSLRHSGKGRDHAVREMLPADVRRLVQRLMGVGEAESAAASKPKPKTNTKTNTKAETKSGDSTGPDVVATGYSYIGPGRMATFARLRPPTPSATPSSSTLSPSTPPPSPRTLQNEVVGLQIEANEHALSVLQAELDAIDDDENSDIDDAQREANMTRALEITFEIQALEDAIAEQEKGLIEEASFDAKDFEAEGAKIEGS